MIVPAIVALLVAPQVTQLDAVLEHRLGSADGSPEQVFGSVSDLAADADGNVYVLEDRADRVRVFSLSGQYLRTIGRRGTGPGEFSRPNRIDVGETAVTVLNPGGRSSAFTSAGQLLESRVLGFGALGAGRLGDETYVVYASAGISRGVPVPTESVIILGPDWADTIVTVPSGDVLFRSPASTLLVRTSLCRLAYSLVGSEGEVWVASGIEGTLTEWRLDGRSAQVGRSVRVAPAGVSLPDSTRSRLVGMLPSQVDLATGDLSLPPTYSSICGLERAGTQTLWLRLQDAGNRERWVGLDTATLRPAVELTAPEGVAMKAFSEGRAYGTWADDVRTSYVDIYRLE